MTLITSHPVGYDAFDYNDGIPPAPDTQWNSDTHAWEWTDIRVSPALIPVSFPAEVKEALANNICIICGAKNCPYIRNTIAYQQLFEALKKRDINKAKKIYAIKFSHLRKTNKPAVDSGLQKANEARKGVRLQPALLFPGGATLQVRQVWAPPFFWGPWVKLATQLSGGSYTISFDTISQAPSSFDVQIEYATGKRIERINTMGPGSYQIRSEAGSVGVDRVRFKSHSLGQIIRVEFR